MLNKDTISMHLVREALMHSCASATIRDEVLLKVGIAPTLLNLTDARIPATVYARLWRLLASRYDDEFFGMDPRKLRAGSLEFMCRAAMAQPTLAQGLDVILSFLSLMLERLPARWVRQQSLAEIVLHSYKFFADIRQQDLCLAGTRDGPACVLLACGAAAV